tara:strand:+ start:354 stop:686 length:333 start_codon:yes stop_codon:yes gene_type:complete
VSEKPNTARSYRTAILDDNAIVSINLKWLGQICVLIGMLVYGYWQIETRITKLENSFIDQSQQIRDLVDKHIVAERLEREELSKQAQDLQDQIKWYEKNINPLSWRKKKK